MEGIIKYIRIFNKTDKIKGFVGEAELTCTFE